MRLRLFGVSKQIEAGVKQKQVLENKKVVKEPMAIMLCQYFSPNMPAATFGDVVPLTKHDYVGLNDCLNYWLAVQLQTTQKTLSFVQDRSQRNVCCIT